MSRLKSPRFEQPERGARDFDLRDGDLIGPDELPRLSKRQRRSLAGTA
jgi:hypothetical protein